jgi:hypothetical protein
MTDVQSDVKESMPILRKSQQSLMWRFLLIGWKLVKA